MSGRGGGSHGNGPQQHQQPAFRPGFGRSSGGGGGGSSQAPHNYVPGLGRGAAGFTTRSDVGSALPPTAAGTGGSRAADARAARVAAATSHNDAAPASLFGAAPSGYVAGAGRGAGALPGVDKSEIGAGGPAGPYDAFGGHAQQAPAVDGQFEPDDDEADQIWEAIDARMNSRRKKRNRDDEGDNKKNSNSESQSARARIGAQFRELKEQLGQVTEGEWSNIPDVGDYSLKYKQSRRQDVFTPLSDTLLEQRSLANRDAAAGRKQMSGNAAAAATAVSDAVWDDDDDGTGGFKSVVTNMSGLSAARGTVLGMSLDKMAHQQQSTASSAAAAAAGGSATASAGGAAGDDDGSKMASKNQNATILDKTGYLTSLASTVPQITADLADIHKARLLLKSVRETNPSHGPGGIASARVDETAGKMLAARQIIQAGCERCPSSTDVWLEAARLHPPEVAKGILAAAVRHIPTSVKLFLKAAELENASSAKKAVLRKGLEANPTSATLWKAAIDLEDAQDARILLSVAVEKIPHAVDMWLALARLETYDNAQRVLNRARKALPTDRSIWIAAAKLEESQNHVQIVDKVVHRAVKSLQKHSAVVTRAQWLEEAERAEAADAPLTGAAIVKYTIGQDVEAEDCQRTWADDAKSCLARGSVATARAILAHSLAAFPQKRSLWMQAVDLERQRGTSDSLDKVLQAATERLPRTEIFWLLWAKEKWLAGDVDRARQVLTEAFQANPDSESIWLAAAKLEHENGEFERARVLLERARTKSPTARVFMKSALLEREQGNHKQALALIEAGLAKYSTFPKLYMMGGQICAEDLPKTKSSLEQARKFYQRGLEKRCTNNVVLWILASRLEERAPIEYVENGSGAPSAAAKTSGFAKARSILELARLKNPKNPELWLEAVRLERRAGSDKLSETLMARALQECPTSGLLLAESIRTATRVEKKAKSAHAIRQCPDNPLVIAAVASLFAAERGKTEKARKWLDRAVILNPDLGDSWARYYAFELRAGKAEQAASVKERCVAAEPKHGEMWTSISKALEHRHKSTAEHLELVAQKIQKTEV